MLTRAKYLWIDLETTGLDPDCECILECAAIVTDAALDEIGEPFTMVLAADEDDRAQADEYVREMHDASGLWLECFASGLLSHHLQDALIEVVSRYDWADEKPILAGSTVHFDRGFLDAWTDVPRVLHHRHLDTSSLKMAVKDACGVPFEKAEAHRALADVRESLAYTRLVYERLRGPAFGVRAVHDVGEID